MKAGQNGFIRGSRIDREARLAIALPLGTALAACVLWHIAVSLWRVPAVILPAPLPVGTAFFASFQELAGHAFVTGFQTLAAFIIATVLGFLTAALLTSSPFLRDLLYPNLVLFQLIPKVALAPIFVVWLGIDAPSRIAFAAFISFFPVFVSTASGLQHTDEHALRLCRALKASKWQTFASVRVPLALPYLFNGMKIAATLAVTGIIIAEFITAKAGLGYVILLSSSRMETARILAAIVMLCIVGLALFGAVALLERAARTWYRA